MELIQSSCSWLAFGIPSNSGKFFVSSAKMTQSREGVSEQNRVGRQLLGPHVADQLLFLPGAVTCVWSLARQTLAVGSSVLQPPDYSFVLHRGHATLLCSTAPGSCTEPQLAVGVVIAAAWGMWVDVNPSWQLRKQGFTLRRGCTRW